MLYLIWKLHLLGVDRGIVHFAVTIRSGRNGRFKNVGKSGYFFKNWIFFQSSSADYSAYRPPTEIYYPSLESLFCQLCGQYKTIFLTWKLVVETADWKKSGRFEKFEKSKKFEKKFRFSKKSPDFPKFLNRPFWPLIIVTAKCAIPLLTPKKCSFHMRYGTLLY